MNWLDDSARERDRRDISSKEIALRGHEVFESLWANIIKWIEEAKTKGHLLSTNDTPESRTIKLDFPRPNAQSILLAKEMKINIAENRSVIAAVFPDNEGEIIFALGICGDGVICMKHESKKIYPNDAAILILGRFIFPEQHGIKREDRIHPTE
jgi:hypothetical protein